MTTSDSNIKIYFDGQKVGYVSIYHISKDVCTCDNAGDIVYSDYYLSTDDMISEKLNREPNDPEARKWPQFQDIKTLAFEFKHGFLCESAYDYDFQPDSKEQQPVAKTTLMVPVDNIQDITIDREPGNYDKLMENDGSKRRPNFSHKDLRKLIDK